MSGGRIDASRPAAADEHQRRSPPTAERAPESASSVEELQQRARQLQAVLDTAIDAIITIDERGIVQSVNPAVQRLFGYGPEEVVGRNVSLLAPSPYREEHDGYLRRYLETGERKIIGIGREIVGQRKDGSTFPIHLAVSELRLGERRLFTGIIRDISDLKQAQQRAVHAERLAAIGQMVTGLAHESRNAIQRAQACQEMLAVDLEGEPELLQLVERTKQALNDLHRLYEEVRSYAAPVKLEPEPCHLAQLWRKTWSHLEITHAGARVELIEELNGVDVTCRVDRLRCEQVFRNILENAIEACPDAGEVRVRCADATLEGAPALRIALCDNGPGLTVEQAQGIFQPFFSTKKKGTGLGMAIAKRLVEAHGGLIQVANVGRAGAEIVVTFPREPL